MISQSEETASAEMGHVWLKDCESLFAHLISSNTKQVDNKRLAIDLSALKQLILDNRDDCDEEVDGSKRRLILVGWTRLQCCQIA